MKVAQHYHIIQIELDWDFLYRKVAKIEFADPQLQVLGRRSNLRNAREFHGERSGNRFQLGC